MKPRENFIWKKALIEPETVVLTKHTRVLQARFSNDHLGVCHGKYVNESSR